MHRGFRSSFWFQPSITHGTEFYICNNPTLWSRINLCLFLIGKGMRLSCSGLGSLSLLRVIGNTWGMQKGQTQSLCQFLVLDHLPLMPTPTFATCLRYREAQISYLLWRQLLRSPYTCIYLTVTSFALIVLSTMCDLCPSS